MQNLKEEIVNFLEKKWVGIGLIVLISTVIYYNSLNVPFILDDIPKIVENSDIKKLSNIKTKLIYPYSKNQTFTRNDPSRPLTYLTFMLNYHFGKLNTFGYHLINILMHIFNAILIFFLTKKIIFYIYKKDNNLFPLFVALFFAVHPVNTGAVTYIFKRSDILATFFYISSLLFFIMTFEKAKKLYIYSLLCFLLSLSSKPMVVTLPAIIFIFDYVFLSDFEIKKVIKKKQYHIPFWIILFVYLLFRYLYFGGIGDLEAIFPAWNRWDYLVIQPYVIVRYFQMLFIPIGLCIDHCLFAPKTIFEIKILVPFLLIISIVMLVLRIYRKKSDISKIVLFCALWFFITLFPTSSFFPTTLPMDDTRLYLSGFGFYLSIVFLYFLILSKDVFCRHPSKWVLLSVMGVHIFLLSGVTVKRNSFFRNPILIWQDVISKYPINSRAHNSLGLLYYKQGKYEKAFKEYQKSLERDPDNPKTHNFLGILYEKLEQYDRAFQSYQKAIQTDPGYADAYYNLGLLYHRQKKYNEAFQSYQKAIQLNPNNAEAHNNLGVLYYKQKKYNEAFQKFQKAIVLNPDYVEARNNLRLLYYKEKNAKKLQ